MSPLFPLPPLLPSPPMPLPHSWAVPSTMAEAGFFHLANTNLASAGIYKPDRVSCFACHVYLYSWEPNDEPWSEHERHAMQCPFMRGDPTENVPLEGEGSIQSCKHHVFITCSYLCGILHVVMHVL